MGVLCLSLFCCAILFVLSSFSIVLRELVAWLLLSYECLVTVNVLRLFFTVPWVGLRYVIVVFPGHTHLLFSVLSSFLYGERESLLLYFNCLPDVLLFFAMHWVGLQCVIVVFPDHSKEGGND